MGTTLRENFWVPVALSQKLIADGKPIPLRVFGENFVAFRSTDGRVGIFNELCPHRGASLLLARNEDNALRCIFHGWKFGVDGRCVEVPTEPHNPELFCSKVPLKHYPTREAAGVVWGWFGKSAPKKFPEFEWTTLPPGQVYVTKQLLNCNWLQNVEGGMDSAHVSVLHQAWKARGAHTNIIGEDLAPVFEFDMGEVGFRYAAIRNQISGKKYIRVTDYVMPWYCFIPPTSLARDCDRLALMSTPVDDYHVLYWNIVFNPFKPITPSVQYPAADPDDFPPATVGGREKAWGQDRSAMARGHFTGFGHINTEDFAVNESQGAIADRSNEYLNASDRAVGELRKQLLGLVEKTLAAGGVAAEFPHDKIDYTCVRAYSGIHPDASSWREEVA